MPAKKLTDALIAIDWIKNVNSFVADASAVEKIAKANLRIATWAKQFETIEKGNPALCFIREMQVSGHLVATSTATATYKSAASAMRTMVETALYYTYFRTHLPELSTLLRNAKWYVSKGDILDFHNTHTPDFSSLQGKLDLVGTLNSWYSNVSAVVHGQIPGKWNQLHGLSDIKHDPNLQSLVINTFLRGEEIVHKLFLCSVGRELWDYMTPAAKKHLIAGLPGDIRAQLGLDSA